MSFTPFSSSFTPLCAGTNVAVTGVNNAQTAYDWFALISGGSGALYTAWNSGTTVSSTTLTLQNKAFIASIANEARAQLLPLVKAELFYAKFMAAKTIINNSVTTILSSLSSSGGILDTSLLGSISTLTPTYTTALSTISATLNNLKSFEAAIYSTSSSIDITSSATSTAFSATTTLTSFTSVKNFLAPLLDPLNLASVTSIPTLTAVNNNVGNAAALQTIFTNVHNNLASLTAASNLQALNEMHTQNIFDLNCAAIQGYTSAGTSGNYVSATAPVGIVPGVDFIIYLTGVEQTGTASQNNPGAPSVALSTIIS